MNINNSAIMLAFTKYIAQYLHNSTDHCLSLTSLRDQFYDNLFSYRTGEANLLSFFKTGQYLTDFKFKVNRISHQMTNKLKSFLTLWENQRESVDHRIPKSPTMIRIKQGSLDLTREEKTRI